MRASARFGPSMRPLRTNTMPSPAASKTACWLRIARLSSRSRCFSAVMSAQTPVTDSTCPAAVHHRQRADADVQRLAATVAQHRFHLEHRATVHCRREAAQEFAAREVRTVEIGDMAPDDFARFDTEHVPACAFGDEGQPALVVADPDQRRRRLDQRTVAALAVAQLQLRDPVLGVVDDRQHQPGRLAIGAAHRFATQDHPDIRAVGPPQPTLLAQRRTGLDMQAPRIEHALAVVRMQRLREPVFLLERLAVLVAENAEVARREEAFAGDQVGVGNAGIDRVERDAQLLAATVEIGVGLLLRPRGDVGTVAQGQVVARARA